jgi:hypothetical protein
MDYIDTCLHGMGGLREAGKPTRMLGLRPCTTPEEVSHAKRHVGKCFHSDRLAQTLTRHVAGLTRHVAGLKIQLTEEQFGDIAKVISEWYSKTLQNVIETLEINSLSKWQQDHPT